MVPNEIRLLSMKRGGARIACCLMSPMCVRIATSDIAYQETEMATITAKKQIGSHKRIKGEITLVRAFPGLHGEEGVRILNE
jgi:hypothetical protein